MTDAHTYSTDWWQRVSNGLEYEDSITPKQQSASYKMIVYGWGTKSMQVRDTLSTCCRSPEGLLWLLPGSLCLGLSISSFREGAEKSQEAGASPLGRQRHRVQNEMGMELESLGHGDTRHPCRALKWLAGWQPLIFKPYSTGTEVVARWLCNSLFWNCIHSNGVPFEVCIG